MPELPEVETTRRGIARYVTDKKICRVTVREARLRYRVPASFNRKLAGNIVKSVKRRGKYIILGLDTGSVIIHLGMSGSIRIVEDSVKPEKHDHIDIVFNDNRCLRYRDPRRFGLVLWTGKNPLEHELLKNLGPEPLMPLFNAKYLYERSRGRKISIKQFIMDSKIVVGVGNIYASEALFLANIHPQRAAGRISMDRLGALCRAMQKVLAAAIKQGGTTLRDFVNNDGRPGYFSQHLKVYDRADQPCFQCGAAIKKINLAQRSTFYCSKCQR
ncbi:MAG: bifunctional DNA-formamidopyrimidine glycosylase/DNA-(apurinic or apyrimidinic site) lyase [Gammaproteobacteria bacterium]